MTYKGAPLMSERQNWATPIEFMEWLEETRGLTFDLDPASVSKTAKAPNYYGPDHPIESCRDGLTADWFGRVWLNPPFGNELKDWLNKCAREIKRKEVDSIYCLIPARTDTKNFHDIIMPHAYLIYLIKGRFNFTDGDTLQKAPNAPFPSMLVVYRKHKLPDAGITVLDVPAHARGHGK